MDGKAEAAKLFANAAYSGVLLRRVDVPPALRRANSSENLSLGINVIVTSKCELITDSIDAQLAGKQTRQQGVSKGGQIRNVRPVCNQRLTKGS